MKIRTWHKAFSVAVALTASLALAACSSGGTAPTTTAPAPSEPGTSAPADTSLGVDDGTQLTMWTRAPLERQAKALVEAYNASHSNQVKLEIIPNDDMEGKIGAAATNNELPDLLAGDVVRLPYWVDSGLFSDVSAKIDGLPFAGDLARGHVDAGTSTDGVKHTVPFVTDISVMVWNKELYAEAGLDPERGPTTLAEFVEQAKAVAALKKDGVSGTYFGGNCGGCLVFTWFPFVWGSGDEVLSADGTESLLAGDNAKAVYAAYKDLVDSGAVGSGSKEETGATWTAPFAEGKVGVMQYPNTSTFAAIEAGIDVGVTGIPGVNGGSSTFLGGDAMGISKDSKSIDQAWNFLAWMLSDETQLEVIAKNGEVPARVSLLDNDYTKQDPIALTMNATVANGRTPVATYFSEAFNAPGSPWTVLFRNAVFEGTDTLQADNQAITDILSQG
ncbi:MAG: sugar ABC transporter substrate-binding protein [Propionicimonas sp.]